MIEANPRASRTVPFVSKATGLPLAKLACRIMLGERVADLDLPDDPMAGDHVSVKEAVLPFDRFEGSDALLGPEMRSTGEVMGIARDFPTAFAKAQAAAGAALPQGGHGVHHRHRRRQARARSAIAAQLHDLGFRIVATRGTAQAIERMGIPVERAQQDRRGLAERRRLDRARRRRPRRSTRRPGSGARTDGWEIRRAAVAARHPVPDDALRRPRRRARDRGARASGERRWCSRCRRSTRRTRRRARRRERDAARAHARAARAPLAEVTGHAALGAYVVLASDDPDGPAPRAGPVLHARRGRALGRGDDERPVPAARLLRRCAIAPTAALEFLLEDVGPGTERLARARARRRAVGPRPARARLRAAARRAAGRCCAAAASAIAPLAIWPGRARRAARAGAAGLPRRRPRRGRGAAARRRASPPTTARPATTASSPTCSPPSSTRDPRAVVYACGPPPMLEAVRALCAERGVPAQLALESRHGLRLRRLLRLRRADARRRLRAPVRRRAGARRRARWTTGARPPGAGH